MSGHREQPRVRPMVLSPDLVPEEVTVGIAVDAFNSFLDQLTIHSQVELLSQLGGIIGERALKLARRTDLDLVPDAKIKDLDRILGQGATRLASHRITNPSLAKPGN